LAPREPVAGDREEPMKIREKLSFMSGTAEPEPAPKESPLPSPPAPAVAPAAPAPGSEGLSEALDTVARVMVGEVESLRRSISELETRMTDRIQAEKQAAAAAVDALRQSQHKTLTDAVDNLREMLERTRTQADDRSKEIRAGLEEILSAKEHKLEKGLAALADKLATVRSDLTQQAEASGHTAALLENVASVFANPKARPGAAAPLGHPETDEPSPARGA